MDKGFFVAIFYVKALTPFCGDAGIIDNRSGVFTVFKNYDQLLWISYVSCV